MKAKYLLGLAGVVLCSLVACGGGGGVNGRQREYEDSIQRDWSQKQADFPLRYRFDTRSWVWWEAGRAGRAITVEEAKTWMVEKYRTFHKVMFLLQTGAEPADADNLRLVSCEFVTDETNFEMPCNGVMRTYLSPWVRFMYKRSYGIKAVSWETYFDQNLVASVFPRDDASHLDACTPDGVDSVARSRLASHNSKYGFPTIEAENSLIGWVNQTLAKELAFADP